MNRKIYLFFGLVLVLTMLLAACVAPAAPPAAPVAEEPAAEEPAVEEPAAEPADSLGLTGRLEGMSWDDIVAAADGQDVNWWMWGGSDTINAWVNGWLADQLKEQYNITMKQVPVAGPTEFINQTLGEKEAGVDDAGAVDIMWINGENFRTMKGADLLYGPWSEAVPSGAFYDWNDASVAFDFGFPVDGYEIPWGGAQVVLQYDSAVIDEPPTDMAALMQWIKDNPGLFTYPAPPDFTGSVWVRMMCYYAAGGYEEFLGEFDQAKFDELTPACWDLFNEIDPYLWREGQTYPDTQQAHIDLFANGEVQFRMTYGPGDAQNRIDNGTYPETVRTFVVSDGTIANTNYIATAYNAANLPAAIVTANFLAGLDAQLDRIENHNWIAPLNVSILPQEALDRLAAVERGPAVLAPAVLSANKAPELQSDWLTALEQGWIENVLKK
ncbi:MAG: ABC transporter substrate-binding protein [Chloroflexi bacterium]|nr:ABC transporter substrate-binding protein [Chloroflexota bacterium]